jgi:hypothetical protein
MLPALLSEQLCSLREAEGAAADEGWATRSESSRAPWPQQRLTVVDTWFGRTIIRSRHQLHYQQAQVPHGLGDTAVFRGRFGIMIESGSANDRGLLLLL